MNCEVYTDGSYNHTAGVVGWAYIILIDGCPPIYTKGFIDDNKDIIAMRNYSGELIAAMAAVQHIIEEEKSIGIDQVTIYHDYEGVGAWPTGKYKKPKNNFSRYYRDKMNMVNKILNINYIHIKSHSGNKWNEKVDQLAKEACGLYYKGDS